MKCSCRGGYWEGRVAEHGVRAGFNRYMSMYAFMYLQILFKML